MAAGHFAYLRACPAAKKEIFVEGLTAFVVLLVIENSYPVKIKN